MKNMNDGRYAYATVLTSEDYLDGIRTLIFSLRKVKSRFPLIVLVPMDFGVRAQEKIVSWGATLLRANQVSLGELAEYNKRTYWNNTFFKLQIFALTQYEKVVYLDSDMIVLDNLDHLFELDHLSAVQGGKMIFGWEDINSGLMVVEPSREEFDELVELIPMVCGNKIKENIGFGDQDVISYYYRHINRKWGPQNRLDERYNAMIRCIHELCVHYGYKNIKVIHFVGEKKPWMFSVPEMVKYVVYYTVHHERYRALCAAKYFWYVIQSKYLLNNL